MIIVSTTGDGEPPDTVLKFMRRIRKKTLPSNYMEHLNFTLLGKTLAALCKAFRQEYYCFNFKWQRYA